MDTTQIEALLREVEHADPADAADRGDALADALEAALDDETREGER
jgi:hypothetical protein